MCCLCIPDCLPSDAIQHLPTSDDDKFSPSHFAKLSTSSAALDLAPLSQNARGRDKSSEWPQFPPSRGVDTIHRPDRRVTTPSLNLANDVSLTNKINSVSATTTPLLSQHQQTLAYLQPPGSQYGSPSGLSDGLSGINAPRSVPTTPNPRSVPATPNLRLVPTTPNPHPIPTTPNPSISHTPSHLMKAPGTPPSAESQCLNSRLSSANIHPIGDLNKGDLRPSLSWISFQFDGSSLNFNGLQATGLEDRLHVGFLASTQKRLLTTLQHQYDPVYNLREELGDEQYVYDLDSDGHLNNTTSNSGGSTVLYHHNGTRYGLGLPGRASGTDTKMNGLHGSKYKHGDVGRKSVRLL